jgi:hypothetical protein
MQVDEPRRDLSNRNRPAAWKTKTMPGLILNAPVKREPAALSQRDTSAGQKFLTKTRAEKSKVASQKRY